MTERDQTIAHSWTVRMIAGPGRMRYRADCICGEHFGDRDKNDEAGLDGLDHIRKVTGRPTRRSELEEEQRQKDAARRKRQGR